MLVKRIKCHIRNTDSSSTGFRKVGPRGNSDFSFFFPFPLLLHYARAETKKEKEEEGYEYPILVGGRKILLSISKEDTHTCDKLVPRFADAFCTVLKTFTGMFLPNKIFGGKWELFFSCGEFLPPPNEARKGKK